MVGTREELGKDAGTDEKRGKKTYPSFFGIDGARQLGEECVKRAINRLESFDHQADPLSRPTAPHCDIYNTATKLRHF
jgi:geranylgeranyl diphosphate synthase type II